MIEMYVHMWWSIILNNAGFDHKDFGFNLSTIENWHKVLDRGKMKPC